VPHNPNLVLRVVLFVSVIRDVLFLGHWSVRHTYCILIGVLSDSRWIRIKPYHLWLTLEVPGCNPLCDTACLDRGLSLVSPFFQANATRASQLGHDHFLPNISNLFTSHLITIIYWIVYLFLYHHSVGPFTWRPVLGWKMISELEVFVCRICTILRFTTAERMTWHLAYSWVSSSPSLAPISSDPY